MSASLRSLADVDANREVKESERTNRDEKMGVEKTMVLDENVKGRRPIGGPRKGGQREGLERKENKSGEALNT